MIGKYVFLAIGFLLFVPGINRAQESAGLFIEMETPGARAMSISAADEARGILSRNNVSVNVQALLNGSMIQHVSNPEKVLAQPDSVEGFLLQLPGGTVVTLVTRRLQSYVEGVETYSGRVKNIESGYFTLSVENGKVFGQVNIGPMVYDVRYDKATRSHVLTEIDQARMPHHTPEPLGDGSAYSATLKSMDVPTPMLTSPDIGTIRVLVLYGSDVSNPTTLTSNIMSSMNDTFFNDGMDPDLHFTLADLRNLNDDLEEVCKEDIRDDMMNDEAPFGNIDTWVADEDADIVLTIVTEDASVNTCTWTGIYGRLGGIAGLYLDSTAPYAITMDTYALGDLTAIHEVGHVLGGFHPQDNDSTLQANSDGELYARGFLDPLDPGDPNDESEWQTIMGAYFRNGCDFSTTFPNTDCVRLPLWSDSTKTYGGEARGEAFTQEDQDPYSADMASALQIHMPIVAAWQSYPYSAPGTPSNIDVEECFSQNIVTWDATTNAENYQVLYSAFSNFTNPEVIYFGSHEYVRVVVSQHSTKYIKIRACNGNGCGTFSSQLTLTYNSYCN